MMPAFSLRPARPALRASNVVAILLVVFVAQTWGDVTCAEGVRYFKIRVVDEQTKRGVPLVELRTVHNVRYLTDSAGVVAFHEPGLMDTEVFFHVSSHGYEFPADGFGYRGRKLLVQPGGEAVLPIKRLNIAERLYRVTGAGQYRDSVLVGEKPPLREPLLNAQVFGSDSVVNEIFRGQMFWFWGDTNRPQYPLGNFQVPGATSRLPADGGLDPSSGVDLQYFVGPQGFAKETARMPGPGPTWISGLVVIKDEAGKERMFASYVKVKGMLDVYERGLVEFDPDQQLFQQAAKFPLDEPLHPQGHSFLLADAESKTPFVYFANPYPFIRVPAVPEALRVPARYEGFTCLQPGTRGAEAKVERDERGQVRWGWKPNTEPITIALQNKLRSSGQLKSGEEWLRLTDVESQRAVIAHTGSVFFNAYRRRWIMIAVEAGGAASYLGEVWYAEADAPQGPWLAAKKIMTHQRYSFYNPKQHPQFDQDGGRVIFFEGTYTHTFSGNNEQTPWYDYNQIMYRLDLSDERLKLEAK